MRGAVLTQRLVAAVPPAADRAIQPAARLAVARLALADFRCYPEARLEPGAASVVLCGPNGAGKTNLLEALSYLVPGRGLRGARLAEVARRAAAEGTPRPWTVAARLRTPDGEIDIGTGQDPEGSGERRIVHVDGKRMRGPAALAERLSMVWLTPAMDRLFSEAPAGRRRFLDRLVYGLDPAHASRLNAYEHALRERARLLIDAQAGQGVADPAWLAALEDTMATTGIAIAAARREVVQRLNTQAAERRDRFPAAVLRLAGPIEAWLDGLPAIDVEDRFRAALAAARDRDALAGGAAVGPHRSDVRVHLLDGGAAAEQCSTGEQKAMLIALVLAQARLQARERGSPPILLLDEVVAHLDKRRRAALFDEIDGLTAQAWLTGTDDTLFAPLAGRAQFYHVERAIIGRPVGRPWSPPPPMVAR